MDKVFRIIIIVSLVINIIANFVEKQFDIVSIACLLLFVYARQEFE